MPRKINTFILSFLADDSGATAIEYSLIAALVSVAAAGTLTALGSSLDTIFALADTALTTAATP